MISCHLRPSVSTFSEYLSFVYDYIRNKSILSIHSNCEVLGMNIGCTDDASSVCVHTLDNPRISHNVLYVMQTDDGQQYCLKMANDPEFAVHETTIGVVMSLLFMPEFCEIDGIVENPSSLRGIVSDHDLQNYYFVKMKYVDGAENFSDVICDQTVSDQDVFTILAYIMAVMQRAFERVAFTHYDLKAENVLVRVSNDEERLIVHVNNDDYRFTTRYAITIIDFECASVTIRGKTIGITGGEIRGIKHGPNPSYDIIRLCFGIIFNRPQLMSLMRPIISMCLNISEISDEELVTLIRTGVYDIEHTHNRVNLSDCWPFNVPVTYGDVLMKIKSVMPSIPVKIGSASLHALIKQ